MPIIPAHQHSITNILTLMITHYHLVSSSSSFYKILDKLIFVDDNELSLPLTGIRG